MGSKKKKKQTNVSLIKVIGRTDCCIKSNISTTAATWPIQAQFTNSSKAKKKSCLKPQQVKTTHTVLSLSQASTHPVSQK